MRWKWSLSRMDEAGAKSITGVPVTAPQYTWKQVLAEVVIVRSERILGGNTEVKLSS